MLFLKMWGCDENGYWEFSELIFNNELEDYLNLDYEGYDIDHR